MDDDILIFIMQCATVIFAFITVCLLLNQFVFHIVPPQPDPTSPIITKNTSFVNREIVSICHGWGNMGMIVALSDKDGNGYYYLSQPFNDKSIIIGDNYTIQYYCDKNNERQIYSFIDNTPQLTDYVKCKYINGICQ